MKKRRANLNRDRLRDQQEAIRVWNEEERKEGERVVESANDATQECERKAGVEELKADLLVIEKEELGRGKFGVVVKGRLTVGDRTEKVTVKKLMKKDKEGELELKKEAELMAKAKNVNVIGLFGMCRVDKCLSLVMEFVEGVTLQRYTSEYSVSMTEVSVLIWDLSKTLSHLHSIPILHCDVGGRNVLKNMAQHVAKLGDFGNSIEGAKGRAKHTPPVNWSAPELLKKKKLFTTATDIFSFGCTVAEAYSGLPPYGEGWVRKELVKAVMEQKKSPTFDAQTAVQEIGHDCLSVLSNMRPTKAEVEKRLSDFCSKDPKSTNRSKLRKATKKESKDVDVEA